MCRRYPDSWPWYGRPHSSCTPGSSPLPLGQSPSGRWYFTMTELRGQTLRQVIEDEHRAWAMAAGDWTSRCLICAFQKTCEAVALAHSRCLLHRELMPQNRMVRADGDTTVWSQRFERCPVAFGWFARSRCPQFPENSPYEARDECFRPD